MLVLILCLSIVSSAWMQVYRETLLLPSHRDSVEADLPLSLAIWSISAVQVPPEVSICALIVYVFGSDQMP